jgi:hypothetical protein
MRKKAIFTVLLLIVLVFTLSVKLTPIMHANVEAEWDVILTASMEGFSDTSEFGVRSDATLGFDTAYDQVDPPDPPMGVVSYFWYPDNDPMFRKLSVSKIPPSLLMTWTYKVTPVNIDGTMCINWSASDIDNIPSECSVSLDGINMREATEHCFAAEMDTTYTFTIQVECQPLGWIVGTVTDADTTDAIEGATVSADGVSDVTDASGFYNITVSPGTYDVTAEMTGYESETVTGVVVAADATVTEDFALAPIATYDLTIAVDGSGTTVPDVGVHSYTEGTDVDVNATADAGWVFDYWLLDGDASGSANPITVTMDDDHALTAVFIEVPPPPQPTIESCNSKGVRDDRFNLDETIYVSGSGYSSSTTYKLYVVDDVTWEDGMPIPARVPSTATELSSDSSGDIRPTAVWADPLTLGKYDIVVDVNGNGVYDQGTDALDDKDITVTAGFFVIPEIWLGTILALAGCFAAFGVFRLLKRRHQ